MAEITNIAQQIFDTFEEVFSGIGCLKEHFLPGQGRYENIQGPIQECDICISERETSEAKITCPPGSC